MAGFQVITEGGDYASKRIISGCFAGRTRRLAHRCLRLGLAAAGINSDAPLRGCRGKQSLLHPPPWKHIGDRSAKRKDAVAMAKAGMARLIVESLHFCSSRRAPVAGRQRPRRNSLRLPDRVNTGA